MASTKLDYDRVARILVDELELGTRKAAERWKVSERTIRNYHRYLETDDELSAAFRRLSGLAESRLVHERITAELGWRRESHRVMRRLLEAGEVVAERIIELARDEEDLKVLKAALDGLGKFVQRLGDIDVAQEALGVGSHDGQPGSSAAEDSGGTGGTGEGGGSSPDPVH